MGENEKKEGAAAAANAAAANGGAANGADKAAAAARLTSGINAGPSYATALRSFGGKGGAFFVV